MQNHNSQLFQNAILSIKLGIIDYKLAETNPDRILSSIRNIYSGLLLFLKEGLMRLSPKDAPGLLIAKQLQPVINPDKTIGVIQGKNKNTIDYEGIKERYESLGIVLDFKPIEKIRKERNNIEHYFSSSNQAIIASVIDEAVLFLIDVTKNILEEDPISLFGDSWQEMLGIKTVYDNEKEQCEKSLSSPGLKKVVTEDTIKIIKDMSCPKCFSDLFKQNQDIKITTIDDVQFICNSCGFEFSLAELLEEYADENYSSINRSTGTDNVKFCYSCNHKTFIDNSEIGSCLYCGEEKDYHECKSCENFLSLEEQDCDGYCISCYKLLHEDDEPEDY